MKEKNKALVLNLFGGPGTGKSTTMGGVFSLLKSWGIDCEQVPEYAKDKVWEESFKVLDSQMSVFGKQYHRINRVADKVECAVTDAPLLFTIIYNKDLTTVDKLVLECFDEFNNFNIFLRRKKKYNPNGRRQSLKQAKDLDEQIYDMLIKYNIPHIEIDATYENIYTIAEMIMEKLGKEVPEDYKLPEKVEFDFGFFKAVLEARPYCDSCGYLEPYTPIWHEEHGLGYCTECIENDEYEDVMGKKHSLKVDISEEDMNNVLKESYRLQIARYKKEASKIRVKLAQLV